MNYEVDFLDLLIRYDLINVYQMDLDSQQELLKCKDANDFCNFGEYFAIKHTVEVSQKVGINTFLDACYSIANKDRNCGKEMI